MTPLDADALQAACTEAGGGWRVEVWPELPSTSDALKARAAREDAVGRIIFAESQTAGRGRRANRWASAPGQDLLFSLALRPPVEMALWPRVTTAAALAVCEAVEETLPLQPQIKWPNDIYLAGKKVAGLLTEVVHGVGGALVILGIGINGNGLELPEGLVALATSLRRECPEPIRSRGLDRTEIAVALLRHLMAARERLEAGFPAVMEAVRRRAWLMGQQVRLLHEGREMWGRVIDLDAEGQLVLMTAGGQRLALSSAEQVRAVEG